MMTLIKNRSMVSEWLNTDLKLFLSWGSSAIMVLLNKLGVEFFEENEIWKTVIMDALTVLLIVISIVYTTIKIIKLIKQPPKK